MGPRNEEKLPNGSAPPVGRGRHRRRRRLRIFGVAGEADVALLLARLFGLRNGAVTMKNSGASVTPTLDDPKAEAHFFGPFLDPANAPYLRCGERPHWYSLRCEDRSTE